MSLLSRLLCNFVVAVFLPEYFRDRGMILNLCFMYVGLPFHELQNLCDSHFSSWGIAAKKMVDNVTGHTTAGGGGGVGWILPGSVADLV